MEKLLNLTKCLECNKTYEDPIILPCNEMICSKHITVNVLFKCSFCKQVHNEPVTGYPRNNKAAVMVKTISEFICKVEFWLNNREAENKCNFLENSIEKAESLSSDPCQFLDEYFGSLRNKIDLTQEHFTQIIVEKKAKEKVIKLGKNIAKVKQNLKAWRESLDAVDFTLNEYWKSLVHTINLENEGIKNLPEKSQSDLLLNKQYKMEPCAILSSNLFKLATITSEKNQPQFSFSEFCSQLTANKQLSSINIFEQNEDSPSAPRAGLFSFDQIGQPSSQQQAPKPSFLFQKSSLPSNFLFEASTEAKSAFTGGLIPSSEPHQSSFKIPCKAAVKVLPLTMVSDKPSLSETLKSDKWNCSGCDAPNKKEDNKCICCGTLKFGTAPHANSRLLILQISNDIKSNSVVKQSLWD